jgi:tetratricopeptide (TPR) repeat protein
MSLRGLLLAPAALLTFLAPAAAQVEAAGSGADGASVYFERAASLFSSGKVKEAADSLREAIRRRPGWSEAYNSLCVAEATLGGKEEAIKHCRKAVALQPGNPNAHYNLGNIYDGLGRHAEAVEEYAKAVRVKPDYAAAYYGMGDAYADLGREAEAVKALEQAVKVKPDFAEALFGLSGIYFKVGRLGDALGAARRVVRLRPDFAEAYANLGVTCNALGAYRDAEEALTNSVKLRPVGRVYQQLGFALYKLGKFEKAAAAYKRATLLEPDSAQARYNLGIVSLELRLKAEALKQHKKLLSLDGQLARRLYGEIYKDKILDVSRGGGPR